jgi:uroporphyrinogen-III synthase
VGVLVTRPAAQAGALVSAIEAHGGTPFFFPVIEIRPRHPDDVAAEAHLLEPPDIAIFVSANAVDYGLSYAADAALYAIGPATAAAIENSGCQTVLRSGSGFDSEHLLEELLNRDVSGQTVRIVRGVGGREMLADTLRARGAHVDYLEVYERRRPEHDNSRIQALCRGLGGGSIGVVTVMSVESLRNLFGFLDAAAMTALATTPLVTPSARVIKEAHNWLTDVTPVLADGPQAEPMLRAIIACSEP